MSETISKDMTIEQILSMFPMKAQKLSQEITNAGLHCVGCSAATWETLEAGMMGHGKTLEEIEGLVGKLNDLLKEQEAEHDPESIQLTERAAEKFKQFAKEDGKENCCLRFGDRLAGCSGFEYILDFCDAAGENDMTFTSHGIQICVEKACVGRVMGCVIDYVDGLQGAGFKISNPNAKSSCGCGSSHGY